MYQDDSCQKSVLKFVRVMSRILVASFFRTRCIIISFVIYIIMKGLNGFLMTQRHCDLERRIWVCNVRKLFGSRM